MGMYDTLHVGGRTEQVKLWGKGSRWFHIGDEVGPPRGGLAPAGDYWVVMNSGGYVHVANGIIRAWNDVSGDGPAVTTRGEAASWAIAGTVPPRSGSRGNSCQRCKRPALRLVEPGEPKSAYQIALQEALSSADQIIAASSGPADRLNAIRSTLAEKTGYHRVRTARVGRLLTLPHDPAGAGVLLGRALSQTPRGADDWAVAAGVVAEFIADLPLEHVIAALRLLAEALPTEDLQDAAQKELPRHPLNAHPRIRERGVSVALRSGAETAGEQPWVTAYGELDFEGAATQAVRVFGAPALSGIPLRFWWHDVAAEQLIADVLSARLCRQLTQLETFETRSAFHGHPGYLDQLSDAQVEAALAEAVQARGH